MAAKATAEIVVSDLIEKALYRKNTNSAWETLNKGQALYPHYEIKTLENTLLTLKLGDGSEVRVAPNSLMRINNPDSTKANQFDLQLIIGKAWAKLRKNVQLGTKLILHTAQARIDIRGTSYEAIAGDTETQLHVFSGNVAVTPESGGGQIQAPVEIKGPHEVSKEEWQMIVAAFHQVRIKKGQIPNQPSKFNLNEVSNDWIKWNLQQDERI